MGEREGQGVGGKVGRREGRGRGREKALSPLTTMHTGTNFLCQPLNSMPPQLLRIPLCDQQKTHLRSSSRWCHLPRKWTLFLPQLTEYGLLCSCMNLTSLSSPSVSTPGSFCTEERKRLCSAQLSHPHADLLGRKQRIMKKTSATTWAIDVNKVTREDASWRSSLVRDLVWQEVRP